MPPVLRGDRVTLRPPRADDLAFSLAFANDEDLRGWLRFWKPTTEPDEVEWLANASASDEPSWVIEVDGRAVGFLAFTGWDKPAGAAEIGLGILGGSDRTRGVGEEACRLAISFGFGEMGLARIHLQVVDDNAPAIRLYERLGFQREGVLRSHVWKRGALRDQIAMGLAKTGEGKREMGTGKGGGETLPISRFPSPLSLRRPTFAGGATTRLAPIASGDAPGPRALSPPRESGEPIEYAALEGDRLLGHLQLHVDWATRVGGVGARWVGDAYEEPLILLARHAARDLGVLRSETRVVAGASATWPVALGRAGFVQRAEAYIRE